jgi:hypothetical protein
LDPARKRENLYARQAMAKSKFLTGKSLNSFSFEGFFYHGKPYNNQAYPLLEKFEESQAACTAEGLHFNQVFLDSLDF